MITTDPQTCECRTKPWVTIDMLGTRYSESGTVIRCPDRDHCHHGAPIRHGVIAPHYRNMPGQCRWEGLRVRESMPCQCGGWPWIQSGTLQFALHEGMVPVNPIRKAECPSCSRVVDVENSRFAVHSRRVREGCIWSGIYIALGSSVPPLGVKAPASIQA